ncbi:chromosome partitioning protein [Micromonospora sp. NPDC049836]|uniref:chromosome partitioning protein n=1 Tax=Micromonospora sp. NPDC049836 TaxID=3364274 RepID=UPI0037942AE9
MVHENADRAHVPGQPPVPERDIEPLWPPEQNDPAATVPPWAAPAQPGAASWPATPPGANTPNSPPSTVPATPPPTPLAEGPAPQTVRPAPVDLDLPFTLDQPPGPATGSVPPPDLAGAAEAAGRPGSPPADDPQPPALAGGLPVTTPEATTPEATTPEVTTPEATTPEATTPPPGRDHGEPDPAGARDESAGGPGGRGESPWAQPPQRATATEPTPTPPGTEPTAPGMATLQPAPPGRDATEPAPTPGPAAADPGGTAAAESGRPSPGPGSPGPGTSVSAPPAVGTGQPPAGAAQPLPDGGTADAADATGDAGPPRLGPFPPSPGVPLHQPPYGNGSAYPPGPVGYGQPGYPPPGAGPAPGPYPPWPQPAATGAPQPAPPQQPGPAPTGYPEQQPGPAPTGYPEQGWAPEPGVTPTAEDFARRRQARPVDPVATMGVRAVVNRIGLVRLPPGRHEQEMKRDIEMVRRNFGGLRQVTVVNPKGGAGKTVAILLLAMTFGQKRGGYVLAWDNNETQGTLGMRAQQDFHSRTVRDMLRDLAQFQGPHGRVGDLSQYVRSQGEGMFDVLASDESATGGEMLTAAAFAEIREVVSRFYKLIFVDTGNNVRAQNWQAAMDATDQLVVTMSARNDSAETAARMLDHLEQSGRQRLVRQAVTVVSMPPSRKEIDLPAIQEHFAARTRAVLLAPYERLIDTGEPIRYGQLSSATRDAWLKIAAAVAEGL